MGEKSDLGEERGRWGCFTVKYRGGLFIRKVIDFDVKR